MGFFCSLEIKMHGETNSGENHLRNFNMHLDDKRLKYKIKSSQFQVQNS